MIRPLPSGWTRAEQSVDLTPGVVWTESQLAVVRSLLAELAKANATVQRVRTEVEAWGDASREWYSEHRYDSGGTAYACGFEDGWNHAEECIGRALDGDRG